MTIRSDEKTYIKGNSKIRVNPLAGFTTLNNASFNIKKYVDFKK